MADVYGNTLTYRNGAWSGYMMPAGNTYGLGSSADNSLIRQSILPTGYNMNFNFNQPQTTQQNNPYDWKEYFNYMKNMSPSEAFALDFKQNPFAVTTGLATTGLNAIGSIWNAVQGYKAYKDQLALARDNYNLQKQAYEANEARNQEKFNWLRQARATSQL